jgi:hypothetical protein
MPNLPVADLTVKGLLRDPSYYRWQTGDLPAEIKQVCEAALFFAEQAFLFGKDYWRWYQSRDPWWLQISVAPQSKVIFERMLVAAPGVEKLTQPVAAIRNGPFEFVGLSFPSAHAAAIQIASAIVKAAGQAALNYRPIDPKQLVILTLEQSNELQAQIAWEAARLALAEQAAGEKAEARAATPSKASAPEASPPLELVEPVKWPTDSDNSALLAYSDIASRAGVAADALRKRLDRWRRENPSEAGRGWMEVPDPGPRQPKHVYRVGAVRHLIFAG